MILNNNKGISVLSDVEALLDSCVAALVCPLGSFYPNKNFGNSVRRSSDKGELLASARYALGTIDGVYVKSIDMTDNEIIFDLMINNEARRVNISLEQNI